MEPEENQPKEADAPEAPNPQASGTEETAAPAHAEHEVQCSQCQGWHSRGDASCPNCGNTVR